MSHTHTSSLSSAVMGTVPLVSRYVVGLSAAETTSAMHPATHVSAIVDIPVLCLVLLFLLLPLLSSSPEVTMNVFHARTLLPLCAHR